MKKVILLLILTLISIRVFSQKETPQEEIKRLKNDIKTHLANIAEFEKEVKILENKITLKDVEVKKLNDSIVSLSNDEKLKKREIEKLTAINKELTNKNKELSDEIKLLSNKIKEIETENKDLEETKKQQEKIILEFTSILKDSADIFFRENSTLRISQNKNVNINFCYYLVALNPPPQLKANIIVKTNNATVFNQNIILYRADVPENILASSGASADDGIERKVFVAYYFIQKTIQNPTIFPNGEYEYNIILLNKNTQLTTKLKNFTLP